MLTTHAKFKALKAKTTVSDYDRRKSSSLHSMFDLRERGVVNLLNSEGLQTTCGHSIQLILAENPSTGYSWQIDESSDQSLFTAIGKYSGSATQSSGVPGVKNITLKINDDAKVGEAMFRAVQVRAW